MNEELTRDVLEAMAGCEGGCSLCEAREVCQGNRYTQFNILASALLEERAKPKVWDGAPEWADRADVSYKGNVKGKINISVYTREPPKTRTRQIAEEISSSLVSASRYSVDIDIIEATLNKYAEKLEGKA